MDSSISKLDTSIVANRGLGNVNNRIANIVDPDETARTSRLVLICTVCIGNCFGLQG